jgi:hypothetical protein
MVINSTRIQFDRFGVILWVYFIWFSLPGDLLAFERLQMVTATSRVLPIAPEAKIHLSRRGIVDLFQEQDGLWRLVALRSGVVMIKVKGATGMVEHTYVIEVIRRDKTPDQAVFGQSRTTRWACQLPTVKCKSLPPGLSGELGDWRLFFQLRALCHEHSPCQFQVTLTPAGRMDLAKRLRQWPGILTAKIASDGHVEVHTNCTNWQDGDEDGLAEHLGVSLAHWLFRCEPQQDVLLMKVRASMLDVSDQHRRVFWGEKGLLDDIDKLGPKHWFRQHRKAQMLGEPVVLLTANKPVEIHHGLEIPVVSSGDNPQEYWRKVGFVLRAKIVEQQNSRFLVVLDFSLSHPGQQRRLMTSQLKTSVWCPLGKVRKVGTLATVSESNQGRRQPFLAHIPLIGPLFRNKQQTSADAKVVLTIELMNPDEEESHQL